jgi:hypothetical protein
MADESLIRVARYDTRGDAHLAKARLEDAGIPCLLTNEAQAGLSMMFDASRSGVQVKVPADRAEEAKALLAETAGSD